MQKFQGSISQIVFKKNSVEFTWIFDFAFVWPKFKAGCSVVHNHARTAQQFCTAEFPCSRGESLLALQFLNVK